MRRAQARWAAPGATSRQAAMGPEAETDTRSSVCAFRRFPRLALLSQPSARPRGSPAFGRGAGRAAGPSPAAKPATCRVRPGGRFARSMIVPGRPWYRTFASENGERRRYSAPPPFTIRRADPGEAFGQVPTEEELLDHAADNRPVEAVVLLVPGGIRCLERGEVCPHALVECRCLGLRGLYAPVTICALVVGGSDLRGVPSESFGYDEPATPGSGQGVGGHLRFAVLTARKEARCFRGLAR